MSKASFVTGLRAVEQLLASRANDVRKVYAEYQTANPRVEAIIAAANRLGIDILPANRSRLQQISGEARHQGVVAEIRRSTVLDEAGLRDLVEQRLTADAAAPLMLLILDGLQDPHNLGACLRTGGRRCRRRTATWGRRSRAGGQQGRRRCGGNAAFRRGRKYRARAGLAGRLRCSNDWHQ